MANPVTLGTLITRVRQRCNIEGNLQGITDWEITDSLNVSLANELYDLLRQSVGDQYFRKQFLITTKLQQNTYDLPADFLTLISVDVWTQPPATPGSTAYKINARRYMEYERNFWNNIQLGWTMGCTAVYTLNGSSIVFQPTPTQSFSVAMNYVPVSPQLGGPKNVGGSVPAGQAQPSNYLDTWDDVNGWSEIAVLDAAAKCATKLKQYDLVSVCEARRAELYKRFSALAALRHTGEPERAQMPWTGQWNGGWTE